MRRRWTPHGPSPVSVAIFASHLLCLHVEASSGPRLLLSPLLSQELDLLLLSILLGRRYQQIREHCAPSFNSYCENKTNQKGAPKERKRKSNDPHSFLRGFVFILLCHKKPNSLRCIQDIEVRERERVSAGYISTCSSPIGTGWKWERTWLYYYTVILLLSAIVCVDWITHPGVALWSYSFLQL